MGSLCEELEAREAAARARVEELEAELAELSGKLELARERLGITRETVTEVLAELEPEMPVVADAGPSRSGERVVSAYAWAERQVIGVLTVPNWQPGMMPDVPFEDRYNAMARPFQWKFTTSDLDDLLARLDRHTADHQEESSAAPAA